MEAALSGALLIVAEPKHVKEPNMAHPLMRLRLLISAAALLLSACPRERHVALVGWAGPRMPVFCMSSGPQCSGEPLEGPFEVVEAKTNKLLWVVSVGNASSALRITYGRMDGSTRPVIGPAPPLKHDLWYRSESTFFRFCRAGDSDVAEVVYGLHAPPAFPSSCAR